MCSYVFFTTKKGGLRVAGKGEGCNIQINVAGESKRHDIGENNGIGAYVLSGGPLKKRLKN